MRTRVFFAAMLILGLAGTGCVHFRQPKEFKNRKMKEDPPLLNQAPTLPLQPALVGLVPGRAAKGV